MTWILILIIAVIVLGMYGNAQAKKKGLVQPKISDPQPEPDAEVLLFERPKPDPLTVITPNRGGAGIEEWKLKGIGDALTLYKTDFDTVKDVRTMLDQNLGLGYDTLTYSIRDIISRTNLRVKEVDDYVAKIKPEIERRVLEVAKADPEWATASALNKESILEEAREKIFESLGESPFCDLDDLIEGADADPTIDDRLYQKYTPLAISYYSSYADKVGKVYRAGVDTYNRQGFEELVTHGLAQSGGAITTESLVESLALKQMNEVRDELVNPKPFTRKAVAAEQLLQYADIRKRVENLLPTRELFQILPAEADLSREQLSELARAKRYDHALASIIGYTYASGSFIAKPYDSPRREY